MSLFYKVFLLIVPFVIVLSIISNFILSDSVEDFFRKYIFSIIVIIPMVLTHDKEFCYWLSSAHLLSTLLTLYESDIPKYQTTELGEVLTPIQSFFRQIRLSLLQDYHYFIYGNYFSWSPVVNDSNCVYLRQFIKFWDALFIATSATCVTNLSTISVGTDLSIFGQSIVLILIQIAGLGIMTLSSSMMVLIGKSLGMKDRIIRQDLLRCFVS